VAVARGDDLVKQIRGLLGEGKISELVDKC